MKEVSCMHIDQLRYFSDLGKTNSINETAKRMYISQPALSDSIKRLEAELNCVLILRSKTGIKFTDKGKIALYHVNALLEQHDQLLQALNMDTSNKTIHGQLLVGVGINVSNSLLPLLMDRTTQMQPKINIHIIEDKNDIILNMLLRGKLDFGIFNVHKSPVKGTILSPSAMATPDEMLKELQFQELYTDPMVCVMMKNHYLSNKKTLVYADLAEIPKTTISTNNIVDDFDYTNVYATHDIIKHQQYMKKMNTVCVMPYSAYNTWFEKKMYVAIPIDDYPPVTVYLVSRKSDFDDNTEIGHLFINILNETINEFLKEHLFNTNQ